VREGESKAGKTRIEDVVRDHGEERPEEVGPKRQKLLENRERPLKTH